MKASHPAGWRALGFAAAALIAASAAEGNDNDVYTIPNGWVNSCTNCHDPQQTPAENNLVQFGWDFYDNGKQWNTALAAKDSDGDTYPNGVELQDPFGLFVFGNPFDPGDPSLVSNPGSSNPRYPLAFPPAEPMCVDPPPGMVAWWTGDTCSQAEDRLGAHHGTYASTPACLPGLVLQVLDLTGGNSVTVPHHPDLEPGTGDFTLDLWIRATGGGGPEPVVTKSGAFQLMAGAGSVTFFVCDAVAEICLPPLSAPLGAGHVAATVEAEMDRIRLFVDGALADELVTPLLGDASSPADLVLGATTGSSFDGYLDEVEIFSRALTPGEIADIYGASSRGKCKASIVGDGRFCVIGSSSGSGWSWDIDGLGPFDVAPPFPQPGDPPVAMVLKFVESINGASIGAVASFDADPDCFDVDLNGQPFELSVGRAGMAPDCVVTGKPSGCTFNPRIYDALAFPGGPALPIPAATGWARGLAVLGVAAAGLVAARRLHRRVRAPIPPVS